LSVHCTPVTAVSSRHLRSANQHQLIVPRCRRITFGRRAFSVAGPTVWNSLPTEFRSLSVSFGDFRRALKMKYSRDISALSTIDMLCIMLHCMNFLFYSISYSILSCGFMLKNERLNVLVFTDWSHTPAIHSSCTRVERC